MESHKFKFLIWQFNAILDTGKYDNVTISEVKNHINAGTISKFLLDCFGNDGDFSIVTEADWPEITKEWKELANYMDEGRKMGVTNKGVCLLLGYCLQSFQSREAKKAA